MMTAAGERVARGSRRVVGKTTSGAMMLGWVQNDGEGKRERGWASRWRGRGKGWVASRTDQVRAPEAKGRGVCWRLRVIDCGRVPSPGVTLFTWVWVRGHLACSPTD